MSSEGDLDSDRNTEECKTKKDSTSSGTESEDDDQESSSYAMGYMPLSQDPDIDDGNEDDNCVVTNGDTDETGTSCCTDDDTIRHPSKPAEDGNCTPMSSIEKNQVDEIKAAMSRFSLPPSAVPEWAKHVPENVWKSELIKGIRTKKDDSR